MRGWIPPLPLACGVLAFGLSWLALFALAYRGTLDASFFALGWVHLVALAWITTIALAVLLHAVPGFLDVEWNGRGFAIARVCTPVFALASLALAAGFFTGSIALLEGAGAIALGALLAYAVAIARPIVHAMRGARVERAIARAFAGTIGLLVLTAALGATFTYALGGRASASWLVGAPQAHALLGIGGWLTLLVVGVSARTMGPIAGARSRFPALHIVAASALFLGTIAAACGAAFQVAGLIFFGGALVMVGCIIYAADIADVAIRATVRHRPPQVLMLCAATWAVVAATLLLATAAGAPFAAAAIYAALIGWIGSAVLAHLHHIGVRVLLTTVRGEDDETRPGAVLDARLSWTTIGLYQLATVLGTAAIALAIPALLEVAAFAGFLSFVTLLANLRSAFRLARRLPIALGSLR
jgi:hypothetical protein